MTAKTTPLPDIRRKKQLVNNTPMLMCGMYMLSVPGRGEYRT